MFGLLSLNRESVLKMSTSGQERQDSNVHIYANIPLQSVAMQYLLLWLISHMFHCFYIHTVLESVMSTYISQSHLREGNQSP